MMSIFQRFASIREWPAVASELLRWHGWRWMLGLYGVLAAYDLFIMHMTPQPDTVPGLTSFGTPWYLWLSGGLILLIIALVSGAQRMAREHEHKLACLREELIRKEAAFRRELTEQEQSLLEFQRKGRLLRDRIRRLGLRWISSYGYEAEDWCDEVHTYLRLRLPIYAEQFLVDDNTVEVVQPYACFEVQTHVNYLDRRLRRLDSIVHCLPAIQNTSSRS
jgi:hypothetical protein